MKLPSEASIDHRLGEFCSVGPRWCGSKGEENAAFFVREAFQKIGLEPRAESFVHTGYLPESYTLTITKPSTTGVKCRPLTFGASTGKDGVRGKLVHLGEATQADYERLKRKGIDFRGKIVLAEAMRAYLAHPLAEKNGAAGFILATDTPGGMIRLGSAAMGGMARIPSVSVSFEDAQFLRSMADNGCEVEMNVRSRSEQITSKNMVAAIRGRSDRKIVVVSHYDSYWVGPHAFDNASGMVGLLFLAEILAKERLNSTVEFVAVSAEELGSLGAASYLKRRIDADDIALCVNLDSMFGSGKSCEPEIQSSPAFAGFVHSILEEIGLRCSRWVSLPSPMLSDHVPFVKSNIPSIWLSSSLPPYYHTELDVPGMVYAKRIKEATALAALIINRFHS